MNNNDHLYEYNIYENIQDIEINKCYNNIIINNHNENFIKICYDKKNKPKLKITSDNNTLKLQQKSKFETGILNIFKRDKYSDIYLYLPKKTFNLSLIAISGNVDCNINKLNNITINNFNGNFYTKVDKACHVKINNANGNITLKNLTIDKLEVIYLNGNIKSCLEAYYVDIKNVNGNVILNFNDSIDNYNIIENNKIYKEYIATKEYKNIHIKNVNGSSSITFEE